MLYEILQYLNVLNYDSGKLIDKLIRREFSIADGTVEIPELTAGQYFAVSGSVFNDGVYAYPASGLTDETFTGTVHALKLPKNFLSIVSEIEEKAKNAKGGNDLVSESFGGYSYTKSTGKNGKPLDAIHAYADRLTPWRML